MKNIAIILAGGAGKRFGADRPKQLLPLEDGRSVLEHAVSAFRSCDCIDEVIVVMHKDWIEQVRPLLPDTQLIPGGRERWESSWNAIAAIGTNRGDVFGDTKCEEEKGGELLNVLIHDAARPFVSERIIRDVCSALCSHEAVTVAVPATDTIYRVQDGCICEIPNRSTMMRAQTPQAFRLSLIRHAYEIARQDPALQATDDCGIVHRYLPDTPIYVVEGEEANRKITFKQDL